MEGINLEKLEAVVDKMLNNINELKKDKAALQAQVEARNVTIAELEEKVSSMTSSQEEVSSRVTNLLSSIEDWERSTEADEEEDRYEAQDTQDIPPAEEQSEKNGGSLFSIGE